MQVVELAGVVMVLSGLVGLGLVHVSGNRNSNVVTR